MKQISALIALLLLTACATTGTNMGTMSDGSMLRTDYTRDTSLATKGGTYEEYYKCDNSGTDCEQVGQLVTSNPTWLQQVFGGAAQVGAAALIGDGLKNSGDNINNVNTIKKKKHGGNRGWSN